MKSPGLLFPALAVLLFLAGCAAQPTLDLGQPGKSLTYVQGLPSFDFEANPENADGSVLISISLPSTSLTFLKTAIGFEAHLDIDVRAFAPRVDTLIRDYAWQDTIAVNTYGETQRENSWVLTRSLTFIPGSVVLRVEVLDEATGKRETRSQMLRIPSPNDVHPFIGRIALQAHGDQGWAMIIPMHVPSGLPGFRANARVFGLRDGDAGVAHISLLRFKLATMVATAPYLSFDYLPTPGEPKTYWLNSPDTIRSGRDSLRARPGGTPNVLFDLTRIPTGLYRLVIEVSLRESARGKDTTLMASRVFSIKPPTFPRPSTLSELVASMVYILTPKEVHLFEEARTPREKQHLFDSLWLSFGSTKEQAADLLKKYYTRVEDANRLYTELKEGWKTDQGMLYIIFGPPADILNSLDRQTWTYDVPGTSQQVQFIFRKIVVGEGDLSVRAYVLYRDASYEWVWERMVQRWRDGTGGW
jgi:GWxTD domain-containing protein